jgi:hypothetical protein
MEPYAIIYIDLDNFKAYNDAYGFPNGDSMIRTLAQSMHQCCSEKDSRRTRSHRLDEGKIQQYDHAECDPIITEGREIMFADKAHQKFDYFEGNQECDRHAR